MEPLTRETLTLLIKSKLNNCSDYYDEDMYEKIYDSFQNHYPKVQIKDLIYVKKRLTPSEDPVIVFRLFDCCIAEWRLIYCSNDLQCDKAKTSRCECCCWSSVDRITIEINSGIVKKTHGCDIYTTPEIFTANINSLHHFVVKSIDLYPFNQGQEMSLSELGFKVDCLQTLISSTTIDENYNLTVKWSDHISIWVGQDEGKIIYKILVNGKIETGLVDKYCTYQQGDHETNFYKYGSSMIIEHCGDVSSVVVINF